MKLEKTMEFLARLEENNSLDWMHNHKEMHRCAKTEFLSWLDSLITAIAVEEPSVAGQQGASLLFRLNRDTRFSKDKRPYNASFRAHISKGGRLPVPVGYFLCVKPGGCFLGGGLFASQFSKATEMVRDALVNDPQGFQKAISNPAFTLSGEQLKNVPRGFDKAHPMAEYLKYKSWYAEYPLTDAVLQTATSAQLAKLFQIVKPFNDWLNTALETFKLPARTV